MSLDVLLFEKQNEAPDESKKFFELATMMVRRGQYMEALDRFKKHLKINTRQLPDVLTFLYKQLRSNYANMNVRIMIADICMYFSDYEQAFDILEDAYEQDPTYTQTYFLLSKLYPNVSFRRDVLALLESAFDTGIRDNSVVGLLPTIYLDEADYDKGIRFYQTLIASDANPPMSYLKGLATFYEKSNDTENLVVTLQRIAQQAPGQIDELTNHCENLLKREPGNIRIMKALISLHLKSYSPQKSVTYIKQLYRSKYYSREEFISELRYVLQLFPSTPDVLLALAEVMIEMDAHTEAVTHLQILADKSDTYSPDIVRLLGTVLDAVPNQILALQLQTDLAFKKQDYQRCLAYIEQLLLTETSEFQLLENRLWELISKDPTLEHQCRYLLARIRYKKGDFEGCKQEAELVFKTPLELKARMLLSSMYQKRGAYSEARQILFEALKNSPYSWDLHQELITFQNDCVKRDCRELENKTFPESPGHDYFMTLGIRYLCKGDMYKALDHFQKIVSDPSTRFQSQLLVGRCFLEMGRFDLAIGQLQRLLDSETDLSETKKNQLRYMIGIAHYNSGKVSDAVSYFETVMASNVNFADVQAIINRIQSQSLLDIRGTVLSGAIGPDNTLTVLSIQNQENNNPSDSLHAPTRMSFGHPHNNNGVDYLLKHHLKTAKEELNLALQMDAGLTSVYCNLAIISLIEQNPEDALSLLETAGKRNPSLDVISLNRGLAYRQQNNLESAKRSFEQALLLNPDCALAKLNLGDIAWENRQVKDAFYYWHDAAESGQFFYLLKRRLLYLHPDPFTVDFWTDHSLLPSLTVNDTDDEVAPTKEINVPVNEQISLFDSVESKKST